MRVRIHRGASEIGGSCVEVEHDGARLVLDVGKPLSAGWDEHVPLPQVPGLATGDTSILGLLISHGHKDHWGLVEQVHPAIPRFIGRGAADVLRAADFWGTGIDLKETGHFEDRKPMELGPFAVTPYLADHSGFDAYSLVIEAGGQRLMYSGDLRGHGRKSAMFERLLLDPPLGVDALLLEGTHVGQDTDVHGLSSESEVEDAIAQTCGATAGNVVILSSAQNIDRLVTCYRAVLPTGRDLVMDLYTAEVMAATGRDTIPRSDPEWPRVRVFVPNGQRLRVRDSAQFAKTKSVREYRIYPEDVAADPGKFLMVGAYRAALPWMIRKGLLDRGCVIWSQWNGYLQNTAGAKLQATLQDAGVRFVEHHTSGHANVADLRRLVAAVRPGVLVPIHTENPDGYAEMFDNLVTCQADGQWWTVGASPT